MATAFVTITAGATTAPLNPAYQRNEFDFYLRDLRAKALLVEQGSTSPAIDVAQALNIPILHLTTDPHQPSGSFRIVPVGGDGSSQLAAQGGFATSDDVALVLHTSGTTSRPKLVPLAHKNICASADHIRQTLALTGEDCCLNIMPLFHIHGLMGAVLASLSAGASIFCSPGFNALQFFAWLTESKATWYTAVPTMHQAILDRAARTRKGWLPHDCALSAHHRPPCRLRFSTNWKRRSMCP